MLASHIYWCRRLGLEPSREVLEKIWAEVPSYWRWHVVDPRDPLYLFKGVEDTPRPFKVVLGVPLVDALHERKGAYIRGNRLVLRLNRRLEFEIPERALRWLEKRLAERPDRKYVRVFEKYGKLVVQIVLHKVNRVAFPENPLLVVVDVNSSYGMVVHFWDERLVKTLKLRPPNKGRGWRTVRKLMSLRDNLCNQACIRREQLNRYGALIRKTLGGSSKTWVQQGASRLIKRIRRMARRRGKQPLVIIDVPDHSSLRGMALQRTLLSFAKRLENLLSWYGVYWVEKRLYSSVCPVCGARLRLLKRTKNRRIMACTKCGFREDRDNVPLYWALKILPALKGEASER